MGGVINIITRKGGKTPHRTVTVEAGSYGTLSTRAIRCRAAMAHGPIRSASTRCTPMDFRAYGYRIGRPIVIGDGVTPLPPLPADDPTNKGGLSGRFTYTLSDDVTIDFGARSSAMRCASTIPSPCSPPMCSVPTINRPC